METHASPRNRTVIIGALALCLLCLFRNASSSSTYMPLSADARLQRKVTLDETAISLEELLQKLSADDLTLSASRSCRTQKIQVRLKQRPLFRLMQSLAQLLPGQWVADDKRGYRLDMNAKAVSRRDRWWRLYLAERERAFAAQRAYILRAMRTDFSSLKPVGDTAERKETPDQSLHNMLPASLQERIANQILENIYYRSGPLWLGSIPQEGGTVVALRDLPPQAQNMVRQSVPSLSNDDAPIHFCNVGYSVIPRVILSTEGPWPSASRSLAVDFAPEALALPLDHRMLSSMASQAGRAMPKAWKELIAYQDSRVWKNDLPATRPNDLTPPRRADVLNWLADKADMEFVSDFYSQPCTPLPLADKAKPLARPLKKELDYRAAELDMSWKKRADGIYLFRNNRWYRDDLLEVPNPILQRWLARRSPLESEDRQGKRPSSATPSAQFKQQLDWQAEIIQTLTPWQIANGLSHYVQEKDSRNFNPEKPAYAWRPFAWIAETTLAQYNALRFYASLSPAMQAALHAGNLSLAALNQEQRALALYCLPSLYLLLERGENVPILLGVHPEQPITSVFGYAGSPTTARLFEIRLRITSPANR